jgi:hypothetical protein
MERNPNVGLEVRSFRNDSTVTFSIFGRDAANFLFNMATDIANGDLVAATPGQAAAHLHNMRQKPTNQTGDRKRGKRGKDPLNEELDDWLADNPNCRAALQKAGKEKFLGDFDQFLDSVQMDTFAPGDANENTLLSDLGVTDPNYKNKTLGEFLTGASGVTLPNIWRVYVKPSSPGYEQGSTPFHEVAFHAFFRTGEHTVALANLGLKIPVSYTFGGRVKINYSPLSAEMIAGPLLDDWLRAGCPKAETFRSRNANYR